MNISGGIGYRLISVEPLQPTVDRFSLDIVPLSWLAVFGQANPMGPGDHQSRTNGYRACIGQK